MLSRPCLDCIVKPAEYRGRCKDCARLHEQGVNRAGKSIYNSKRWKVARRRCLFANPICRCGKTAHHVHHIKDIAEGGDPFSAENLQSLCHSCHSKETRARQIAREGRV